MYSTVWFRRRLTNLDSQEIIFSKRGEYTLNENQESKFPLSEIPYVN